jgi:NAD(P)-dependent dehydrogenase (short-subunit alcohol dehydrogenase family)
MGTNHLGHALLTKLLLPTLLKTAKLPGSDVRVVNLSSSAHTRCPAPGVDFEDIGLSNANPMDRYTQSKLANIYFAKQLAVRYPGITSVAVHPGIVRTNLFDTMKTGSRMLNTLSNTFGWAVYVSIPDGAKNQLWAATAKKEDVKSGEYYVPVGEKNKGSPFAQDVKAAEKLWTWTEDELRKHGY